MKKINILGLGLMLLSVPLFAQSVQELDRSLALSLAQSCYDKAVECEKAVEDKKFEKAESVCTETLSLYEGFKNHCQEKGIKVFKGMASGINVVQDPLSFHPDIQENIWFSQVMSNKISLKELLDQHRNLKGSNGLLAALLNNGTQRINVHYIVVAETFRNWEGCVRSIQEAGLDMDAEAFCTPSGKKSKSNKKRS